MSTEEHKAIARRFHESFNTAEEPAVLAALLAPDFQAYVPGAPGPLSGEAWQDYNRAFSSAFPDSRIAIEDLVAEGEKVAVRARFRGTHRGEFQGIAPTGRQVTITGNLIDRIVGGKVVEHRAEFDALGLLQQLGALPVPE